MKILPILCFFVIMIGEGKANTSPEQNSPITVAVIDTGFDFNATWPDHQSKIDTDGYQLRKPKLCKQGHTDFTGSGLKDNYGHGTHVTGIIAKFAEDADYCIIVLKYFDREQEKDSHMETTLKALKKAIDLKVSIINYSGGGTSKSNVECDLIKQAIDMGIVVVAAAGNERLNLNNTPYYPAMCDSRVVIVSNTDDMGNITASSNFTDKRKGSREIVGEKGLNVLSLLPNNKYGVMTGTSQSAPTHTGKLIKKIKKK